MTTVDLPPGTVIIERSDWYEYLSGRITWQELLTRRTTEIAPEPDR